MPAVAAPSQFPEICSTTPTLKSSPRRLLNLEMARFTSLSTMQDSPGMVLFTGYLLSQQSVMTIANCWQTTDKQWDTIVALHCTAPFKLIRAAAPYFRVKD